MEKNKTGKYLKYAIGEIILVVIGILIALQINNWNEKRKAYANSKNYLSEIISDLQKDTLRFNDGIAGIDNFIKDEEWALNKEDYTYRDVNRLWDCFGGWVNDYEINNRTFQKIQNEGSSKFVGFDALFEKINTYYTILEDRTEGFTAWDALVVWNQQTYMLDLQETLEISNYRLQTIGANQVEITFPMRQDSLTNAKMVIDFANSTLGRNHFKNNYFRHKRIQNWFIEVVSEATKLMEEIEEELEK